MKTRPVLIVIASLIIGFIIGFLVNGQLTRQRFQSFVSQDHQNAFKFRMMDIIQPNDLQTKEIDPILDDYARRVHETMMASKEKFRELNDDLLNDLEPYLNQDQLDRLDRANQRFEHMMRNRAGRHGPPHGNRRGPGPGPGPGR